MIPEHALPPGDGQSHDAEHRRFEPVGKTPASSGTWTAGRPFERGRRYPEARHAARVKRCGVQRLAARQPQRCLARTAPRCMALHGDGFGTVEHPRLSGDPRQHETCDAAALRPWW